MSTYAETIQALEASCGQASSWSDISPEYAARMRLQNKFSKTGLDIARYTAAIMREDMANYDWDPSQYTQSLGCWQWFHWSAETDRHQKALWQHREALPLFVGLDDRGAAIGFQSAT